LTGLKREPVQCEESEEIYKVLNNNNNRSKYVEMIKSMMNENIETQFSEANGSAKIVDDENSITKSKKIDDDNLELDDVDDKGYDNESYVATGFVANTTVQIVSDDVAEIPPEKMIIKLAVESRVEIPNGLRMTLRNLVMSLLISNSVLWLFISLDGTAFQLNMYQSEYYGEMGWNVITLICKPLFILYRMHSAGCLFEIWSYA